MKIGGLDIGTTGCKLTVFDENGRQLGKAYRNYHSELPLTSSEIDISAIMESVYAVIGELCAQYPDIGAIGVTSFGETCVMTDGEGNCLHPAMLYIDTRGEVEYKELSEKLGREKIIGITGLNPHEMYSIGKLMWLKKHRPEIYAAAKHIFLIEDYVVFHLTGVAQIDYSLASRTMAFDINKLAWSEEIFDAAGIDVSLMSKPVPTGTPAGNITKAVAGKTGLNEGCVIVSVSHDQVAAAVGAGAFDGSVAVDGAGTTECLTPIFDSVPDAQTMAAGNFSIVPYIIPGKYVAYAFSFTGGALVQWAMDTVGRGETNESMERAYGKDEPTGLLVLPHFAGAATPYMDNGSRGAILGLTTDSRPADIYRACMEGVVYEMRLNHEELKKSDVRFKRLNATGGGAKSKVWMQMKADILNMPVTALETVDAGTIGSAMLTGMAIGIFSDIKDAASKMVVEKETYYPRAEMHAKYTEIYNRYARVYQAVRPLM